MMHYRLEQLRSNGSKGLQWTVLPPQFRTGIYDKESKYGSIYANGTNELYPPFWEVRYVYFPLYIRKMDEWLLARIDLHTMQMVHYCTSHRYSSEYKELITLPLLDPFPLIFQWLLEEINYWEHYTGPYISRDNRTLNVHVANEEYVPENGVELGGDSGVLMCLLMHNLVRNKTVNMQGDFKDKCMRFRRHMADRLYQGRFLPG
jgi:hypothetical protein